MVSVELFHTPGQTRFRKQPSIRTPIQYFGVRGQFGNYGDLNFSLMRAPVLSASNQGLKRQRSAISQGKQDTAIISIRQRRHGLDLQNRQERDSSLAFDCTNKQRDTMLTAVSVPRHERYVCLRESRSGATPSLSKAVTGFHVHINDSIPDSMLPAQKCGIMAAGARMIGSASNDGAGNKLLFKSNTQIERISIIDASGKLGFSRADPVPHGNFMERKPCR